MPLQIHLSDEPCQLIEHWHQVQIIENSTPMEQACWVQVGNKLHIKYWIGGKVFELMMEIGG